MGKFRFLLTAIVLVGASSVAWAQESDEDLRDIENFRKDVERAVVNPIVYWGQEGANIDDGKFMFCEQSRTRFLDWRAPVDEVTSVRDAATGKIQMSMSFKPSYVEVKAYSKQAWSFCQYVGGETRVDVGSVKASISLTPILARNNPDVSVDSLVLDEIDIKAFGQFGPFKFHFDLFKVFDEGIDIVVNKTLRSMLASGLKKRLDQFATEKLGAQLDDIRQSHAHPGRPITGPIIH